MRLTNRISRILLLTRCIIRAFFHGRACQIPERASKVIVVPTGKLGDVVCVTPVLRAIRDHLPGARIIVAGPIKLHKSVLADSGLVDEYMELEGRGALEQVKKCEADAALVTGPAFEPTALFYLSGIPLVVAPQVVGGFSPYETRPYKVLQKLVKTFPYRTDGYAPRERLRALEPLGIFSDDTRKHLGFSKGADQKSDQFFADRGIDLRKDFVVGISPSVGSKIKKWPEERFVKVADYLARTHKAKIIIIGGPKDKEEVEKTRNLLSDNTKVFTTTNFNVDELKALIAKLHLFISVDTGPIYIAEAFSVPTVNIVGPVDERVQPPRGHLHRNVLPPGRIKPEISVLNASFINKKEAARQVLSIAAQAVVEEAEKLINDFRRR